MYNFFIKTAAPTVWIICGIELILLIYLVYKSIKSKSLFIYLVTAITFGLLYDSFITSLGTVIDASNIMFLSRLRFILHSSLVPLLFIISEEALNPKKQIKIAIVITTLVLITIGLVSIIFTKYSVIDFAGISRLTVNKEETAKIVTKIPTIINIVSIIPLIGIGIYILIKEKNIHLLLAGLLMFLFSAIGPIIKLTDFIFLISMFGEVLMIVFLILYRIKK